MYVNKLGMGEGRGDACLCPVGMFKKNLPQLLAQGAVETETGESVKRVAFTQASGARRVYEILMIRPSGDASFYQNELGMTTRVSMTSG